MNSQNPFHPGAAQESKADTLLHSERTEWSLHFNKAHFKVQIPAGGRMFTKLEVFPISPSVSHRVTWLS